MREHDRTAVIHVEGRFDSELEIHNSYLLPFLEARRHSPLFLLPIDLKVHQALFILTRDWAIWLVFIVCLSCKHINGLLLDEFIKVGLNKALVLRSYFKS